MRNTEKENTMTLEDLKTHLILPTTKAKKDPKLNRLQKPGILCSHEDGSTVEGRIESKEGVPNIVFTVQVRANGRHMSNTRSHSNMPGNAPVEQFTAFMAKYTFIKEIGAGELA